MSGPEGQSDGYQSFRWPTALLRERGAPVRPRAGPAAAAAAIPGNLGPASQGSQVIRYGRKNTTILMPVKGSAYWPFPIYHLAKVIYHLAKVAPVTGPRFLGIAAAAAEPAEPADCVWTGLDATGTAHVRLG